MGRRKSTDRGIYEYAQTAALAGNFGRGGSFFHHKCIFMLAADQHRIIDAYNVRIQIFITGRDTQEPPALDEEGWIYEDKI